MVWGAACGGAGADRDESLAGIIGGTPDTSDGAVVALIGSTPAKGTFLCTGSVVSPHVILTAAHCVPDGVAMKVYGGTNLIAAGVDDFLSVAATFAHPSFDSDRPQRGYDLGAVVLRDPYAAASPLPMNRTALVPAELGSTVRVVGYGVSNATTQQGAGQRRTAMLEIDTFDALLIGLGDATHNTCNGDSGGPAFLTLDGRDVIIGVTSFGPVPCNGVSHDTRLDTLIDFVDGVIAMVDPASAPPDAGMLADNPPPGLDPGAPARSDSGCSVARGGGAAEIALAFVLGLVRRRKLRAGKSVTSS